MRFFHRPYVPVAQRKIQAQKASAKLTRESGRSAAPVVIDGRAIAKSFWGCAWCDHLEAFSDYANRLPRGRTYVRNGSVIDLRIEPGQVIALVQGSSLYRIRIQFQPMQADRWKAFKQRSSGKVTNLVDLLQGRLSKEILADVTRRDTGLFPAPAEIKMNCSCPDWAGMCKHLAAVLYGVGSRLDDQPELLFVLRGVEVSELVAAATASAAGPISGEANVATDPTLAGEDLSALFGVELDSGSPSPTVHTSPQAGSAGDAATVVPVPSSGTSQRPPAEPTPAIGNATARKPATQRHKVTRAKQPKPSKPGATRSEKRPKTAVKRANTKQKKPRPQPSHRAKGAARSKARSKR
jgi:uncharacterized Zn finger protein